MRSLVSRVRFVELVEEVFREGAVGNQDAFQLCNQHEADAPANVVVNVEGFAVSLLRCLL